VHPQRLKQLAYRLKQGAVIAYPTETVWGFGCLANQQAALLRLAQIKQRDNNKGFIIISPNIELCLPYIDLQYHQLSCEKISCNKAQPTTWIAPKSALVSPLLSGQYNSIAIRISPHPFVQDVCSLTQTPLVSTSANLSTKQQLNSALLITRHFRNVLDTIVHGYSDGNGKSSQIFDLISNNRLR